MNKSVITVVIFVLLMFIWISTQTEWDSLLVTEPSAVIEKHTIIIHHTAGDYRETIESIERWHIYGRGWSEIGYHFVIGRDGTVYEGRSLDKRGAHAGSIRNIGSIGIAIMGSFEDGSMPAQAQLDSLIWLVDDLLYRFPITTITNHHERCPGPGVVEFINERWQDVF